MEEKIQYFAYGANRDPIMISAITGVPQEELVGRKAVVRGYRLAIQNLEQIPDTISPTAPEAISPRQILKNAWGENFSSYVLIEDPNGEVEGMIWELTPEQRACVRDWELLDFGWFSDARGVAIDNDGNEIDVVTECISNDQEVDKFIDGLNYETWLYPPEVFIKKAIIAHQEYMDRLSRERLNQS